jgi:hypothetical protein
MLSCIFQFLSTVTGAASDLLIFKGPLKGLGDDGSFIFAFSLLCCMDPLLRTFIFNGACIFHCPGAMVQ